MESSWVRTEPAISTKAATTKVKGIFFNNFFPFYPIFSFFKQFGHF